MQKPKKSRKRPQQSAVAPGVGISKSLAWLAFHGWQIGEPNLARWLALARYDSQIWLLWLTLARYASQISQLITSQYIFPQANSRASQAIFVQTILYEFV